MKTSEKMQAQIHPGKITLSAAGILSVFLGFSLATVPSQAQVSASAPIAVKKTSSKSVISTQDTWLKGEVIHADANSIIVREQGDGMMIHTFTYTADLRPQMQKILDQGGYQYGDKVRILYQSGQTVALKVRGKPSKPI